MVSYRFAGLNVTIDGMEHAPYFRKRLSEYEANSFERSDITICHSEPDCIERPPGDVLIKNGIRHWITTADGGYGIYDCMPNSDDLIACVIADRDWKSITTKLIDTTKLGGSPNDVRCFYMLGDIIKHAMLLHDGIILHASTISYDGQGVAFSAPPGTGKSTHTGLWKELYKEEVHILNDDAPAIRFAMGTAIISGLPWSGTSEINENVSLPLRAVICLEQSEENCIERLDAKDAIFKILNETTKPYYPEMMPILVKRVEQLIKSTPFYLCKCNISTDAAIMVKNEVFK